VVVNAAAVGVLLATDILVISAVVFFAFGNF
jgi:hypothetical protein